ncbi:MAG TPA: hypothetical protein VIW26_03025 [Gemmatimonadales bacterium]|jgi:hypothetical protein
MATYQLRPMSFGEILDGALTVLRQHFGLFFALAVICLGVPTVIDLSTTFSGEPNPGLSLLSRLLSAIGYLLLTGASVYVVSETYLQRTPQLGPALRFAGGKMGALFISGFAAGLVTVLAFIALIVPGIIVACGYAVTVQVVVLETLPSATDSLGRSWALTKGYKGKALGLFSIMLLIFFVVLFGVGVLIGLAEAAFPILTIPAMILFAVLMLFAYPFSSCVLTLFYYDLRVRKEALDLELLGQQIGQSQTVS